MLYWLLLTLYWLLLALYWRSTDALLTLYWLSTDSLPTLCWFLLDCFGSAMGLRIENSWEHSKLNDWTGWIGLDMSQTTTTARALLSSSAKNRLVDSLWYPGCYMHLIILSESVPNADLEYQICPPTLTIWYSSNWNGVVGWIFFLVGHIFSLFSNVSKVTSLWDRFLCGNRKVWPVHKPTNLE